MTAGILLTFLALVVVALFLVWRGVSSAVAPLAAVCATALFITVLGYCNALVLGGWLYHFVALGLAAWMAYGFFVKQKKMPALGLGFWFFIAASLGVIVLFWVRQPMFLHWDEFSTWGTASKLTKMYNILYSNAPIGWPWVATQPPALMNFSYYMQFWGAEFSEWQTYAAYDVLQFSCIAALLLPFEKKQWNIALPVLLIGLLTPYMLTLYSTPTKIAPVYMDSYADVPLALLFAAGLACYFGMEKKSVATMVPLCLTLGMLTLTKDLVGIALALVVAVMVFVDVLFENGTPSIKFLKRFGRAFGYFGVCAAAAVTAFVSWSQYLKVTLHVDTGNLGGGANLSMPQMVLQFMGELFSSQKSEKFVAIVFGTPDAKGMMGLFLTEKITLLGSGAIVMAICIFIAAMAAFITKDRVLRRRSILFGIFSTLGFVAYYAFLTMYFLYIFTNEQNFHSYERYVYPYYIGCFLVATLLLASAARNSRFVVEGKAAILLLCLVLCFRFWQNVPLSYSVLGFHTSEFEGRREFSAEVKGITSRLEQDGTTFIVSTGPAGDFQWFVYCYEFLPYQVDYSFGGTSDGNGHLYKGEKMPDGSVVKHNITLEEWEEYLIDNHCAYVLVDEADEAFIAIYGSLFEDGMQGYTQGRTNLYEVQVQNNKVALVPTT